MSNYPNEAKVIIDALQLIPHPEGGYYREIYRSGNKVGVSAEKYSSDSYSAVTSIYFLLAEGDFSAWHKIKSDEIWCYHGGSAINILSINPQGKLNHYRLGNTVSDANLDYQVIVPGGDWFCAYVDKPGAYALAGCIVAPGFEFVDFELADREELSQKFKQHQALIHKYTREG